MAPDDNVFLTLKSDYSVTTKCDQNTTLAIMNLVTLLCYLRPTLIVNYTGDQIGQLFANWATFGGL
jgi:hypothetical protein